MSAHQSPGGRTPGFSDTLHLIRARAHANGENGLTFRELVDIFGPKGHAFLTIFLVLPFLQPIPIPGLSTLIGLVIALVGVHMLLDRPPFIPQRFGTRSVDSQILFRICSGLERLMRRLERVVRPRGRDIFQRRWFRRLNGIVITIHAGFLSLPLPIPLSNFFPALVLLLVALGTLEEDFYVVVTSYFAVLVNMAFFVSLVLIPYLSVTMLNS